MGFEELVFDNESAKQYQNTLQLNIRRHSSYLTVNDITGPDALISVMQICVLTKFPP